MMSAAIPDATEVITVETVVDALRTARLASTSEDALQLSIAHRLEEMQIAFEREVRISPASRIDFMVSDGIGIEAKVQYPRRSIYRQLERYAMLDSVRALILVTGTAIGLPPTINLKPVFIVSIGRTAL